MTLALANAHTSDFLGSTRNPRQPQLDGFGSAPNDLVASGEPFECVPRRGSSRARGEKRSPFVTSGVRIGTAALTTRGMDEADMRSIGGWIADVLDAPEDEGVRGRVRNGVAELTAARPLY